MLVKPLNCLSLMRTFAALLDRLAYEPGRSAKIALMVDYFQTTPDPERGWALAAITRDVSFSTAKPALIRQLITERIDPVLFELSYDYVGDLSETVSLLWPADQGAKSNDLSLTTVIESLQAEKKARVPKLLIGWLNTLDETGRWALLKLITGGLRVGVSARLAKTAVAGLGPLEPNDIEEVWHGLKPPYEALFAWAEGKADKPSTSDPAPFRPPMLAHPIDEQTDFEKLASDDFCAEWKWDGIRVQASAGFDADGRLVQRLYSRTGDDISNAFPDVTQALTFDGTIDGELLILIDGRVQPFGVLQQRLNRKTVSAKLLKSHPAHIRAYDILILNGEDLRALPFEERRKRLETWAEIQSSERLDISPQVPFESWEALGQARADPASAGAGDDADAVEGLMIKRNASPYLPGRPKGEWYKWKRDPETIDAVLMYAQRGHGKRSSYYSDYTFGVWRNTEIGEPELVPVGKAYFGFTDEELVQIDKYVRNNTTNRFGPVREVSFGLDRGLVLEIAFEGLNRSTRHKSGVAMRFPRISRLRWDKPAAEADRLETLEKLLPQEDV